MLANVVYTVRLRHRSTSLGPTRLRSGRCWRKDFGFSCVVLIRQHQRGSLLRPCSALPLSTRKVRSCELEALSIIHPSCCRRCSCSNGSHRHVMLAVVVSVARPSAIAGVYRSGLAIGGFGSLSSLFIKSSLHDEMLKLTQSMGRH